MAHTRHAEMETLYWIKAASALGLPQTSLPDSELPIARRRATRELRHFIEQNAPGFAIPLEPEAMVFDGWHELCARHGPVFVEKSPHHLHQWSALALLARAIRAHTDIDYRFIGLVRNPMDVLYSMWSRWRTLPEIMQQHWRLAHENLWRWHETVGDRLTIVRYEDVVLSADQPLRLMSALGLEPKIPGAERFMIAGSVLKWKQDPQFGFRLDPAVMQMAQRFGYDEHELHNEPRAGWRRHRRLARLARNAKLPVMSLRHIARRAIRRDTRVD